MKEVYINKEAEKAVIDYLAKEFKVVLVSGSSKVVENIRNHSDLYMCRLGYSPKAPLFLGDVEKVSSPYPSEVIYNGVSTGKYFIHNLKYTDSYLLKKVEELDQEIINVKQGYCRCTTFAVDENSIITSDEGIYKACAKKGLDCLLVETKKILLRGYDYGFIGGTLGHLGKVVVANGNLMGISQGEDIIQFIERRGFRCKWFEEFPLTDIGSII